MVDMNDKVILNSPETEKALNFAKALYDNMIPGVAGWNPRERPAPMHADVNEAARRLSG